MSGRMFIIGSDDIKYPASPMFDKMDKFKIIDSIIEECTTYDIFITSLSVDVDTKNTEITCSALISADQCDLMITSINKHLNMT